MSAKFIEKNNNKKEHINPFKSSEKKVKKKIIKTPDKKKLVSKKVWKSKNNTKSISNNNVK